MSEEPKTCAACGETFIWHGFGKYADFCSVECRNMGRVDCKGCGKKLPQAEHGPRRDFHNNLCRQRYYRGAAVSETLLEERHRTICKCGCGMPITQSKSGRKLFYNTTHSGKYHRMLRQGLNITGKWDNFAPETQKALLDVEKFMGPI